MQSGADGKEIRVRRVAVPTDPSIEIFDVEVGDDKSVWKETIPTEEALHWFFRGLQAGGSVFGNKYIALPEIPRNSVPLDSENPEL